MFLRRLDGLDPIIGTQGGLCIGDISIEVRMVETPVFKGGYGLRNGLFADTRAWYCLLSTCLLLLKVRWTGQERELIEMCVRGIHTFSRVDSWPRNIDTLAGVMGNAGIAVQPSMLAVCSA